MDSFGVPSKQKYFSIKELKVKNAGKQSLEKWRSRETVSALKHRSKKEKAETNTEGDAAGVGGWWMQWWGLCVCLCGRGVDGFWCVINQQHLPWHCLDSRLRAALLCCAVPSISCTPFAPSLCLSVCLAFLFFPLFCFFISPAFLCSPSSLYLSVALSFSHSLLSQQPFCLILSLSLSLHFNCPSSFLSPVCCSLHPDCLVSGGWLLEPQSLIEMGSLW